MKKRTIYFINFLIKNKMKKITLLKSVLLLCALVAGSGSAWAASGDPSWSYTVVNGDASKLNTSSKTFTVDANHVWNYAVTKAAGDTDPAITIGSYSSTYGIKFGESGSKYYSPVILSTSAFNAYKVTKVAIKIKHNGKKVGTLTVKQGDITIGTATTANTSDWITVTCSETNKGDGGTLSIQYEVAQAIYVNKIEVWYEKAISFPAGKTMISFSDANNALDFTTAKLPSGFAAYKATAANASSVTLAAVNDVAAKNSGLIFTGTAGTSYDIPVVATGTNISTTNLLVASDGTSNVTDAYVLSGGKFHPVQAAGIVIPAGKAYLPAGSISSAHALDIVFGDETTGIKAVENAQPILDGAFYNLAGQRVAQPTKGLYIVNGKKVIIK